jgi:SAM-dependent methyltransferase
LSADPSSGFPDHFSSVAADYARFRPTYPDPLFDWIAAIAPARDRAWDCACGSGQATLPLAERFARVTGTDASAEQLRQVPLHPRIEWRVAPAEESGLPDHSYDAVTIAQALHWFDLPRFWSEVRRVVRHDGIIVACSYGVARFDDSRITAAFNAFHDGEVGPYWPIERGHVDMRYQGIDFPFERIEAPEFDMRSHWSLDQLAGYLGTWSATRRYIADRGRDPVAPFAKELAGQWGDGTRAVIWPLTVLAGRLT